MLPQVTQPPQPQPFFGANIGRGKQNRSLKDMRQQSWYPGAVLWEDLAQASWIPFYFPLVTLLPHSLPAQDLHKIKACQPAQHKDLTAQKLTESDKLLYVLDGDAAIARHMKHPQGDMITEE